MRITGRKIRISHPFGFGISKNQGKFPKPVCGVGWVICRGAPVHGDAKDSRLAYSAPRPRRRFRAQR